MTRPHIHEQDPADLTRCACGAPWQRVLRRRAEYRRWYARVRRVRDGVHRHEQDPGHPDRCLGCGKRWARVISRREVDRRRYADRRARTLSGRAKALLAARSGPTVDTGLVTDPADVAFLTLYGALEHAAEAARIGVLTQTTHAEALRWRQRLALLRHVADLVKADYLAAEGWRVAGALNRLLTEEPSQ